MLNYQKPSWRDFHFPEMYVVGRAAEPHGLLAGPPRPQLAPKTTSAAVPASGYDGALLSAYGLLEQFGNRNGQSGIDANGNGGGERIDDGGKALALEVVDGCFALLWIDYPVFAYPCVGIETSLGEVVHAAA